MTEVLKAHNLHKKPKVMKATMSSVKDWIANKSWHLRNYFLKIGLFRNWKKLILGTNYHIEHSNENYDIEFPDVNHLKEHVSVENIIDWLAILRTCVDLKRLVDNPKLIKPLKEVYVYYFR